MPERPIDTYVEVDDESRPDLAARIVIEIPKGNTTGAAKFYDDLAVAVAVLGEGDEDGDTLEDVLAASGVACKAANQKPQHESMMATLAGRMRLALNAAAALMTGLASGVQVTEDESCS